VSVTVRTALCRVDALYSFFVRWSPNVTGDGEVSVNDRGFVVLQAAADTGAPAAAAAATDSAATELPPTNHPGRVWHVSRLLSLSPSFSFEYIVDNIILRSLSVRRHRKSGSLYCLLHCISLF